MLFIILKFSLHGNVVVGWNKIFLRTSIQFLQNFHLFFSKKINRRKSTNPNVCKPEILGYKVGGFTILSLKKKTKLKIIFSRIIKTA